MTQSQPSTESFTQRFASAGLILLAVAALTIFLFVLRYWQAGVTDNATVAPVQADNPARLEMSQRLTQPGVGGAAPNKKASSLFFPLLAFSLALGAGVCVGRFWPASKIEDAPTGEATDVTVAQVPSDDVAEPAIDEETAALEEPFAPASSPSISIDELPLDEALAAKDEVIESLENIVKENRDRWNDYEMERDELNAKIRDLKAELRIAGDIIEGIHGDGATDDVTFDPPQVLSRA